MRALSSFAVLSCFLSALTAAVGADDSAAERTLSEWVDIRIDPNSSERDQAQRVLLTRTDELAPFASKLANVLREETEPNDSTGALLEQIGPPAVPALQTMLDDKSPAIRTRTALVLGAIGPEAKPAIPSLVELLGDKDEGELFVRPSVAEAAVDALAAMGLESLSPLRKALHHQSALVRCNAVRAIGMMGKTAEPAIEDVAQACGDEDDTVAENALDAIGMISDQKELIEPGPLRALRHKSEEIRWLAARKLGEFGTSKSVELLIETLQNDSSAMVRAAAATALGAIDANPMLVLPALSRAFDDQAAYSYCRDFVLSRSTVRLDAIEALHEFGADACSLADDLFKVFERDVPRLDAYLALRAIGSMGASAQELVPRLETHLHHDRFALHVADTLLRIDPQHKAAKAVLRRRLSALADEGKIYEAGERLDAKPLSDIARQVLVEALSHQQPRLRFVAATALANADVKSDAVRAILEQEMQDPVAQLRGTDLDAAIILARKFDSKAARDNLLAMWVDAVKLWGEIGRIDESIVAMGQRALPVVMGQLDGYPPQSLRVMKILQMMGPKAKDAVPKLVDCLKHDDVRVRAEAAKTIGAVGPGSRAAERALTEALQDRRLPVRVEAARALPKVALDQQSAIQALGTLEGTEYITLRQAVADSLKMLGSGVD